MTSNICKLRNVPWSHSHFQAGIPGPEEQIEAALDFWLSVLFPKSLACPEDSGHREGSKLQDWHHRRREIAFHRCQTPSPCLSSFNSKVLLTLRMFPAPCPSGMVRPCFSWIFAFLWCQWAHLPFLVSHTAGNRRALLSTLCPLSQLQVIFHSFLHTH